MTVKQLIATYRDKARMLKIQANGFDDRADALELDLRSLGYGTNGTATSSVLTSEPSVVTAEMVRGAVRQYGGRIKNIANRLSTHENLIAAIVKNPDNGIRDKGRGWLEVISEFDPAAPWNQAPEGDE